jgi:hypothetical protein
MNSMSQEGIHPNKWTSMVTTSFTSHVKRDSRSLIANALKLFTPTTDSETFELTYSKMQQKMIARVLYYYLEENYSPEIALKILTLAYESGHLIRIIILKYFTSEYQMSKEDEQLLTIFEKRTNFEEVAVNPLVINLLSIESIPETIFVRDYQNIEMAELLMLFFKVKSNKKDKLKIASVLCMDGPSLDQLLSSRPKLKSISEKVSYLKSILRFKTTTAKALGISSATLTKILQREEVSTRTNNKIAPRFSSQLMVHVFFSSFLDKDQIATFLDRLGLLRR